MILLVDVGNTQTVFSVKSENGFLSWRLNTKRDEVPSTYRSFLNACFKDIAKSVDDIDAVMVASVVPSVDKVLRAFFKNDLYVPIEFVSALSDYLEMNILIDQPETLGADRVVNAVYAKEKCDAACVIVDFGTATTFDVIDGQGDYVGGVIAPGVNLSMSALYQAAAKLPKIELKPVQKVLAKNTVDAMNSGVFLGYASMVEGMIARLEKDLGQSLQVIATGGLASLFESEIDRIDLVESDLTVTGLDILAQRMFANLDSRKAISNG